MGRELTRSELLFEASDAATRLRKVSSRGDTHRYTDDEVFRSAVAFLWLRYAEPLCQLVIRRLVGDAARRAWDGMCDIRNMLAHERNQNIDFAALWDELPTTLNLTEAPLDRLLADS